AVRVMMATGMGLALLAAGHFMRTRSARVAQGMTAAGVADLYGCLLAAVNMYHFVSPGAGIVLMISLTALAIALSLLHGPFVGLLGLVGGFLMPAFVRMGEGEPAKLFPYLLVLQIAMLAVSRYRQW